MAHLQIANLNTLHNDTDLVELNDTLQQNIYGSINQALLSLLTSEQSQVSAGTSPSGVYVVSFKLDFGKGNEIVQR